MTPTDNRFERRLDTQGQILVELFSALDDVVLVHLRAIEDLLAERLSVTSTEFTARIQKAQEIVGLERQFSAEWGELRRRVRTIVESSGRTDSPRED